MPTRTMLSYPLPTADGCYYVNDVATYAGLFKYTDGKYYYANSRDLIITGTRANDKGQYWVTETNDIVPAGFYTVDENGVFTFS